jgi:ABC-type phosphate transport system substrate-binding protein
MLQVNGVPPTKASIIVGKYPFRRPMYLVIGKKTARPEMRQFVEYPLSAKGQEYISSLGIPSLKDVK